jgi:DNA-binding NarL/FixJ family response regulator
MMHITIIEDQPIILEGIKVLVNQINDFKVIQEFNNGEDFMKHIDSITSDIILTDIEMPNMGGVALTKRALTTQPDLKIIVLTMYNERK